MKKEKVIMKDKIRTIGKFKVCVKPGGGVRWWREIGAGKNGNGGPMIPLWLQDVSGRKVTVRHIESLNKGKGE